MCKIYMLARILYVYTIYVQFTCSMYLGRKKKYVSYTCWPLKRMQTPKDTFYDFIIPNLQSYT